MNNSSVSQSKGEKKHPKILLTITTIFGILYLIFIIENFIHEPYNFESTIVNSAFIIFLVGYYYSWKNEMIAGIIFII
jgi:heme/copper-type cytochrome/quinol oxidase subunit 3